MVRVLVVWLLGLEVRVDRVEVGQSREEVVVGSVLLVGWASEDLVAVVERLLALVELVS